jgi:DNA-binding SARP family transcriptional activator
VDYRVLGPLAAFDDDGRALPLRGAKQRALLAILLTCAGRVAPLDWLMDELWNGAPPETAASALRVHITALRSVLEHDRPRTAPSVRLPLASPGYRLTMDPDELDAQRFERAVVLGRNALSRGRPHEAVEVLGAGLALWRGAPYADAGDATCVRIESQRLQELRVACIEELFDGRLALGEHSAVAEDVAAAVASHPLRERLTGQLALALYRSGRQADALRALTALRERLLEELGVTPSAASTALEHALLDQDSALAWAPPSTPERLGRQSRGQLRARPSFVGRKPEFDTLRAALGAVAEGGSRTVFVGGAPGIGKTALCTAFAEDAMEQGALYGYGRCDLDPVGPYQPFSEALRSLFRQQPVDLRSEPAAAEVARLVPELSPTLPERQQTDEDPDTDRQRLFEGVASLLRAMPTPVVLVLDDLQWADIPSLLLVRHLARHTDTGRLLLIATFRDDETDNNNLVEMMNRLAREQTAEQVALVGLTENEIENLIPTIARAAVLSDVLPLTQPLHEYTGGNPFFVIEIMRVFNESGVDMAGSELSDLVPARVRDLVGEQLARLDATTTSLLQTAAVIGQEFDLSLLAKAAAVNEEHVLFAVEEALAARLVQEQTMAVDRFAFKHAVVRSVIYGQLPASRRMRAHRRVGEALEELLGEHRQGRYMELAHHFIEAAPIGTAEIAAAHAVAAAEEAEIGLAFEDAIAVCERALAALPADDQATTEHCDLLFRLGRAQLLAGRDGARETLLLAFRRADELGDVDRMAYPLLSLNRGFFARMARVDRDLVAAIERAIGVRTSADDATTCELMAMLASELVWADDGDRRFALSDDALAMARRLGANRTLARVLILRNMTISAPDTLEQRTRNCEELFELAEQLHDPSVWFQAAFNRSGTAFEAGAMDTAERIVDMAGEKALDLRQPTAQWIAAFMSFGPTIGRGRLADAEARAHHALELGRRSHHYTEAQMFFGEQLLEVRRWQDRLGEMTDFFGEHAGVDGLDHGYTMLRYLADAGETDAAERAYEQVMRRLVLPLRRDLLQVVTLDNLSYLVARFGDSRRASELYDALLPAADQVSHTTVPKPVAHHYLGLLAATRGELERSEQHLTAAIRAHELIGLPLFAAESRVEWAAVALRRGRNLEAVEPALDAVRGIAADCDAPFLTRRCREVSATAPG